MVAIRNLVPTLPVGQACLFAIHIDALKRKVTSGLKTIHPLSLQTQHFCGSCSVPTSGSRFWARRSVEK
jgi:hypothetical protein